MGLSRTGEFSLKFGYQHGCSGFVQMKINYTFDTGMDLMALGPMIHRREGIIQATPKVIRFFDRARGEFYFSGMRVNSYGPEQHLSFNPSATELVCR